MTKSLLTFDQDWAPNWMLESIFESWKFKGLSNAVFFVTSNSDHETIALLEQMKFEIGIHPNFDGCNKEDDFIREVSLLLEKAPNVNKIRSHRLLSSNLISEILAQHFPQIIHDYSFISYMQNSRIEKFPTTFGMQNRICMSWEDDIALRGDNFEQSLLNVFQLDYAVLDFHPIHIYLNTDKFDSYLKVRNNIDIPNSKHDELLPFINNINFGVRNFFEAVITKSESVDKDS